MSLRPLVLWVSRQPGMTIRFSRRDETRAEGVLTDPDGSQNFTYDRTDRQLYLADRTLRLNEFGWEVDAEGRTVFRSKRSD